MNLRRSFLALAAVVAVTLATPHAALAQEPLRGVALVIGNGKYRHLAGLDNPDRDARAVEALLDRLGFETELSSDLDARRLARDLDDFVEDAEGADVAVLYYAGHGIEAGGENWLVPVDADISAPKNAEDALVPLSRVLARLRSTVAVTIVLLDACRDNPFPAGATLRLASGQSAAISAAGLAAADGRGATGMAPTAASGTDALGIVVGFAAEPGKVALDGAPGGNSPYAEALVRHLSAMAGAEFGQVMRMVGEEVYLKTAGRQRPWVNESLRRLLYFGEAPAAPSGDEGDILAERRRLLLTIADLPDLRRLQVERAAAQGGVPMDALYGLLAALGQDLPADDSSLQDLLVSAAERAATLIAEREALTSPDPEIMRLSELADRAEGEGLLAKSDELRERAKARYLEIEPTLKDRYEVLRRHFIDGAAVFARSAETKTLAFDHLAAAQDYAAAFARVDGHDPALAWRYKQAETIALIQQGQYRRDMAALERAAAAGEHALRVAVAMNDTARRAATLEVMANVAMVRGWRSGDRVGREQAVEAYRAAFREQDREGDPVGWARTRVGLGISLVLAAKGSGDAAGLPEAVDHIRAAADAYSRDGRTRQWAGAQANLGFALASLAALENSPDRMREAVTAYRAALREQTRGNWPLGWATIQNNLGVALRFIGSAERDTAILDEAIAALRAAMLERRRDRTPVDWAQTQTNLGLALRAAGDLSRSPAMLGLAVGHLQAALQETSREGAPLEWAALQRDLGNAHWSLDRWVQGSQHLEQAASHYRDAFAALAGQGDADHEARSGFDVGVTLRALGERRQDAKLLTEAVGFLRDSAAQTRRDEAPMEWARRQHSLGNALLSLGEATGDTASLNEAVGAYLAALTIRTRSEHPELWRTTWDSLGYAGATLLDLGDFSIALRLAAATSLADVAVLLASEMDQLVDEIDRDIEPVDAEVCDLQPNLC